MGQHAIYYDYIKQVHHLVCQTQSLWNHIRFNNKLIQNTQILSAFVWLFEASHWTGAAFDTFSPTSMKLV